MTCSGRRHLQRLGNPLGSPGVLQEHANGLAVTSRDGDVQR